MADGQKRVMQKEPQYCVYYDKRSEEIIDFIPAHIDPDFRNGVISAWRQEIPRKILKALSEGPLTMQELRKKIGHSNSTLHENVMKLEDAGLVKTGLSYTGNKVRTLAPVFLFVTKAPKFRTNIQRFFQGMWVNSDANQSVVNFLSKHPEKYYTAEEIAAKTSLSVDDVELVLSSWDSQVTRALSDFLKDRPFEKKVLYKGRSL